MSDVIFNIFGVVGLIGLGYILLSFYETHLLAKSLIEENERLEKEKKELKKEIEILQREKIYLFFLTKKGGKNENN